MVHFRFSVAAVVMMFVMEAAPDANAANPYGYLPVINATGGSNGSTATVVALYRPKNSPHGNQPTFVFWGPLGNKKFVPAKGKYILWANNPRHRLFLVGVLDLDRIFRRDPNSTIVIAKPKDIGRYGVFVYDKFGGYEYKFR